ncbi:hypothetical protein KM043_015664 [Ampulex compressa]|nr:hypothetical protein KM043_015664 [Ampulex compressa]
MRSPPRIAGPIPGTGPTDKPVAPATISAGYIQELAALKLEPPQPSPHRPRLPPASRYPRGCPRRITGNLPTDPARGGTTPGDGSSCPTTPPQHRRGVPGGQSVRLHPSHLPPRWNQHRRYVDGTEVWLRVQPGGWVVIEVRRRPDAPTARGRID